MKHGLELVKMAIDLNQLLMNKKESITNERDWNAYDAGKEINIKKYISGFEKSIESAVPNAETVSGFRKDFESIKSDINAL